MGHSHFCHFLTLFTGLNWLKPASELFAGKNANPDLGRHLFFDPRLRLGQRINNNLGPKEIIYRPRVVVYKVCTLLSTPPECLLNCAVCS